LKWLIVVDVKQQILLAQRARQGPWVGTRAIPKPITCIFGNAGGRKVLFFCTTTSRLFGKERCAGRCSAIFRRNSTDKGRR